MDDTLIELKERLHLQSLPRRMECYDISNIQGRFVVGGGVVFLDGRGEKSRFTVVTVFAGWMVRTILPLFPRSLAAVLRVRGLLSTACPIWLLLMAASGS